MLSDEEKVAKLLTDALNLMNDNGSHWVQGHEKIAHPKNPDEFRYCTIGAIKELAPGKKNKNLRAKAYRRLARANPFWKGYAFRSIEDIININDSHRMNWNKMENWFKTAINACRKASD